MSRFAIEQEITLTEADIAQEDRTFYLSVWVERPHVCQCCREELFEPRLFMFHHVLEKRAKRHSPHLDYSKFRYCKWNILVLCWQCHDAYERHPGLVIIKPVIEYRNKLLWMLNEGYMYTEDQIWLIDEKPDFTLIRQLFSKQIIILDNEPNIDTDIGTAAV